MESHVVIERLDRVMRIRFNREAKKNALTTAMYGRLADALLEAEEDRDIRAILFTGGPTVFTAGNDLNDFLDPARDASAVERFLAALPTASKPLVAAVNGYAVGIGTTMLLHCDLVYVGRGATLRMPFVDLGLVPECASSLLVPRLVGHQRASRVLLLGEPMSGRDAERYGLASEVLDDERVQSHALERARFLASRSPTAVQQTKALLRADGRQQVPAVMQREGELFAAALQSAEAREAMTATMEKRDPDFSNL